MGKTVSDRQKTPSTFARQLGDMCPEFLSSPEAPTTATLDQAGGKQVAANNPGLAGCRLVFQRLPGPTQASLVGSAY